MRCKHGIELRDYKGNLMGCVICTGNARETPDANKAKSKRTKQEPQARTDAVVRRWRKAGPQPELPQRYCIGCMRQIENPHTCRTGSIVSGLAFKSITVDRRSPVIAVIETWDKSYVVGGHYYTDKVPVGFYTRNKGYICDGCSTCLTQIKDSRGNLIPLIKIDRDKSSETTILPSREHIPGSMPNRAYQPFEETKPLLNSRRDNHWLNVGRKR